jgi:hypothetical protein
MNRGNLLDHTRAAFCNNCGFVDATIRQNGADRCTECGQFVEEEPDVCCERHEIQNSPYPSGLCPRCEQERSVRAQEQEMQQRRANPRMHTSVDAPRY